MAGTHTGPVFSSKINGQPVVEGEHETRGASPPMRSAILGSFALSQLAPIVARRLLLWGIGLGTWHLADGISPSLHRRLPGLPGRMCKGLLEEVQEDADAGA